ncbi:Hypothetical Protein FCC1311_045362 [Hondaea fermentalgiana]|uniref:Uncharacterized protein n=1 Tax=Hondaea fermentalgiana TaxID=2315210 RepID=A0A2R5GI31_9STRA|nr:Hypothetical Protein FCC1311_045362 [Hondaea fermentalgiana]|eukprot:GBG28313.1 Hypothetical Protein FCC1311_045362 [Hondaea fermentalgiana]
MLDGPAGEAVASCFWGRGRLSESSEATEALKLLSINSTEYVGDLALTWRRFQRPLPWLIWMGLVGITFWAIAAAGTRTLHYRLYRTRNWSSEHIVILFINVSSALIGIDSAAIQTDTGNAHYIVVLLPFIMIIVQLLTIIKLCHAMTRISAALVALAAALLSQLQQTHASLILRVPDKEHVVLAEVTMPFNHLVGLRANETYTPSRESLPVTFVNDELMTSLCEVFQSDSIGDAYAGHLLVFHDGLDFMCHGTIGKQIDYKYMEKWCQLNASIVMFSQTYDYMLAHPMDRFREILAGEAGDAVASCFWARGRAVTSDEASTVLTMVQENPGLYRGNVSIDYTRFNRSIGWLVWTGVMSATFFAVSIMGIRILVHRLRISYQISAMHVIVLCINICVTFILGSISAAKLARRVPMGLVLLVYQDFFTLGTATSVLLVDIYADASEHLSLDKGNSFRKWRKRSFVVVLFLLLAVEFFADYAVMGNNTGGESMLVVIIAPTLILIQIVVIASLWRKTTETANLLRNAHLSQQNTSTILFREIELHLRFWSMFGSLGRD